MYTPHTLNYLVELGLDAQKAHKTALKLHAYHEQNDSVLYACKLTTTRRALEKSSCSHLASTACGTWYGAGGCLSLSRSSLVLPYPWCRRLKVLWANVSPFP